MGYLDNYTDKEKRKQYMREYSRKYSLKRYHDRKTKRINPKDYPEAIRLKERVCRKHGQTQHVLVSDGGYKCKKCGYDAVKRRKIKLKKMAVDYKGGGCCWCSYAECMGSLVFHHVDPIKKEFQITSSNRVAWEKIRKELDKCVLLCANCHGEIHELLEN